MTQIIALINAAVVFGTVILYGATGEILTEKSGNLNLGVPGIMMHTLEVSQTARTVAKCLRLNEDLVEAIALGHDLGHTPFGHDRGPGA